MGDCSNNMFPIDQLILQKYARNLTPLGRKAMSTLIKIKNDRKNNFNEALHLTPHPRLQSKETITDNINTSGTLAIFNDIYIENRSININERHLQSKNDALTCVSSSADLLKSASNDDIRMITKDNNNVCNNLSTKCYLINSNNKQNTSHNMEKGSSSDISWNNMFDTEMLQCITVADEDNSTKKSNTENLLFNIKSAVDVDKILPENCENVTEKRKRKCKTNVASDHKKVKINVSKKTNDRKKNQKEKYVTRVNKWLNNNSDITNFKDESIIGLDHEYDKINELAPEEKKLNANGFMIRKYIQAQLANKNGIMKFRRPVNVRKAVKDAGISETNAASSTEQETPEALKYTNDQAGKEKTVSDKFVPPIKSQLPVKDITYEVIVVNDLNFDTYKNNLEVIEAGECAMTIIYSNGFCQLNQQHTDDTHSPEGLMFSFQDTFYYIKGKVDGVAEFLRRALTNISIISFDAKNVLIYLMCQYELCFNNVKIIDIKIGASLLDPDEPPDSFSAVQKLVAFKPEFTIATQCSLQKAAWYLTLLRTCADTLRCSLTQHGLWNLFVDIEMRVLPIIAGMEWRGVSVDVERLRAMERALLARVQRVESRCHEAAGRQFQVGSPAQVRAVLYDDLKLDAKCNVKIRETISKGAKSTSESMLRSLCEAHPLPRLVLEYRRLQKAHATFLAGIASHARDGLLHPTWDQTAAATGRIACNNPNLQAIPKMPFQMHSYPTDDENDTESLNLRSLYVARAGHVLLAADFKHIECRVFAAAAADAALQAALESPDLFRVLAARWLKKSEAQVVPEERERTKRVVYAGMYGAGARCLADALRLGYDQALALMTSFNRTFPSLKSFGRSVVERCAASAGRVRTASGRARTLPDICSADGAARAHAERQAINFIIQGTAADVCKIAMVVTAEQLEERASGAAHLLLQIHDELVWEVRDTHLQVVADTIKQAMEGSGGAGGAPRLPVAVRCGPRWGELRDMPHINNS